MSIIAGFEDMQPKEVLGIDGKGLLLVDFGDEVHRYKLFVGPTGGLRACPYIEPQTNSIDQLGPRVQTSLARRLADIDQS